MKKIASFFILMVLVVFCSSHATFATEVQNIKIFGFIQLGTSKLDDVIHKFKLMNCKEGKIRDGLNVKSFDFEVDPSSPCIRLPNIKSVVVKAHKDSGIVYEAGFFFEPDHDVFSQYEEVLRRKYGYPTNFYISEENNGGDPRYVWSLGDLTIKLETFPLLIKPYNSKKISSLFYQLENNQDLKEMESLL